MFLAEFDYTILDTGGTTQADQVKKTFLSNYFFLKLKSTLVATLVLAGYHDYCKLLYTVNANLEALEKEQKRCTTPSQYTRQPSLVAVADVFSLLDTIDWEPVQATAIRPGRLNPLGRGKRRCYYCDSNQHLIRDCPVPLLQQQTCIKSQTMAVASVRKAPSDETEEQGKEQLLAKVTTKNVKRY